MASITRSSRIAAGLCLVLALVLHGWHLGDKSIWIDEAVGWRFSALALPQLLTSTAADVHSPLYYLLLKIWTSVAGDSLIGLRSLSVVSSLAAVLLMLWLGKTLPRLLAVAAVLWYVVSPQTVYLAQEARMYAPLAAAVLGAAVAYRSWVDSGFTSRRSLSWYVVATAAAIYLHLFALLLIGAMALHFVAISAGWCRDLSKPSREAMRTWFKAQLLVLLAYLPWLPFTLYQIVKGQSWRQATTYADSENYAALFFRKVMFGSHLSSPPPDWQLIVVGSVLLVGIAMLSIRAIAHRRETDVFFALAGVMPCGLGLLTRPFVGEVDLSRYVAYAVPFMILACARGLAGREWNARAALATATVLAAGCVPALGLGAYYKMPVRDYDAKPLVTFLQTSPGNPMSRGEEIIVVPGYSVLTLRYLSRDTINYDRVETDEILKERLNRAASEHRVVWVVEDYRWWLIHGPIESARSNLVEVPVPSLDTKRLRLFKTVVPQ